MNEIHAFQTSGITLYAVIRNASGQVWYIVGEVFEAWGTGARTAADYDIALTDKSGGMFVGNFDTNIVAGYYTIVTHQQAGANPADDDPAIWQELGYWSGTTWTPTPIAMQVQTIYTKLPTNYIMGSSDVDNHDTTIDTINSNIGTPANIDTGGATLSANLQKIADDNAGATFDATRDSLNVIRTRGDLAWVTGTSAGATNVYTISTLIRTVGDNDGGSSTDVNVQDGNSFSTGELGTTTKLEVDATFVAAVDETPMSIMVWGYYAGGGGHYQRVQAYNYVNSVFEDVGTLGNGTVVSESTFGLTSQHINLSTGAMAVKFLHSAHAGVIAHVLHIDKLIVTTSHNAALITAVEAILVDTNEIQGKLPDDYIMGSSVTTSMDDEINNINANSGKVVYGSVASPSGVKQTINAGSVTGFVPDEDRP